jgi:peptidyl-dipeptidase A
MRGLVTTFTLLLLAGPLPAARLGIKPDEMMPHDYSNRFFQEAPNLTTQDFDKPLAAKDVARFYRERGLGADAILARSDLYERPGKYPHAFCTDIDRKGHVRTLMNIKPNQSWLDTSLHELGHGVYSHYVKRATGQELSPKAFAARFVK